MGFGGSQVHAHKHVSMVVSAVVSDNLEFHCKMAILSALEYWMLNVSMQKIRVSRRTPFVPEPGIALEGMQCSPWISQSQAVCFTIIHHKLTNGLPWNLRRLPKLLQLNVASRHIGNMVVSAVFSDSLEFHFKMTFYSALEYWILNESVQTNRVSHRTPIV